MTDFKKIKAGSILGETQYYTVVKVVGNEVQLNTSSGSLVVNKDYVEKFLTSADQFDKEETKTKSELAELILSNPRIVCTVEFFKQNKDKTKKAYKADLEAQAKQVSEDFLKKGISAIEEALSNPVLSYIPGELRVMKGYHFGELDDLGRIQFIDMEASDGHTRQVDPRTIQSIILSGVKYNLK